MKDKLIELLRAGEREFAKECRKHFDCRECSCFIFGYSPNCLDALTADYLMANGVTIQRWIPVEERLPDVNKGKGGYECVGVIARIEGRKATVYRIYERAINRGKTVYRWKYPWDRISDEKVTHWMPLPEPPKEET